MNVSRPWPIRKNLEEVAALEAEAVRITGRSGARVFEMADGQLWTIRNEQPANSKVQHLQYVNLLLREDAEDIYGWTPQ